MSSLHPLNAYSLGHYRFLVGKSIVDVIIVTTRM
jgi:hypothetical protein